MSAKQIIAKHYQRIIAAWPVDVLRPEVSFQKALRRRMGVKLHDNEGPSASNISANDAQVTVSTPARFDEKGELEQVNSLYSLLENRYTKKYPLSEKMLKPASNPQYYENLVKELEEAPKRSWLQAKIQSWKGFLRLS